jgi:hypothetical protein
MSDCDIGNAGGRNPSGHPEAGEWRGDLCFLAAPTGKSPIVNMVHAHWNTIRGDRPFPRRNEIDPIPIWTCLTYLTIVDYQRDPFRIRMSLVGSEVARQCAGLVGGRYLDQMEWPVQDFIDTTLVYSRLFDEKVPLFGLSRTSFEGHEGYVFEWAVFPLSNDGIGVTGALSVDDYTAVTGRRPMAL